MRKSALAAILWLTLVLHSSPLHSSPLPLPDHARFVFQNVGEDLGLNTITPVFLFQDQQGFIWIASMNGLLRYDGTRAIKFGPDQGVPDAVIEQIAQGADDRIWLATKSGLAVQSGSKFRNVALPAGVHALAVYQPIAVQGDHLFLATDNGLWALAADDASSSLTFQKQFFAGSEVAGVYASNDKKIWFVSGGRVGWMDEDLHAHFLPGKNEIPKEQVVALLQDGKGRLWLRTSRHLVRLDRGAADFVFDAPDLPPANDIGSPAIDRKGRLMIPTVSGLFLHNEDRWDVVDKKRGTATNAIFSVMQDREGTYWLGLGGHGLQRWQGEETWSGWTDAEGLPDNVVWSELRDTQQRLWVGTNNGVAMWDPERHRFRVWKGPDGLNGSIARQLALGPDGSVWVLCHPGGLTRFDPNSLRPQKVTTPGIELTAVGLGPDGRIWIAGRQGLKRLLVPTSPFRFEEIPGPREIVGRVTAFSTSADGTLWASGRDGLARYDGRTWSHYSRQDGLLSDYLTQVVAVNRNEAWVRYADAPGITQFSARDQAPAVKHFDQRTGLQSNEIFMLGKDHEEGIWAGGSQGVARISPDGSVRHYSHADGLLWDDQSEDVFFAEMDGTILFGTSGGLARFDQRAEATLSPSPFNVVFTSARLGGQERLADQQPFTSHKENALQAEFAALSYQDLATLHCWYRLNGLESERTETRSREVRYAALAPGSYGLEVSCQSGTGVKATPAMFSFTVLPAWWQRWWTRDLGMLLLGLALYGTLRLRTYALEKDRRRLEKAVAERSRELERVNQNLREASLTDPLTGARNRRFFQLTIEADATQAIRFYMTERNPSHRRRHDLIFYVIDADHFKQVNDRYGHAVGDELLSEMTRRIQSAVRMSDVLVRWGGEEFLVVSRYTDRSQATTLASRILHVVGSEPFLLKNVPEPLRKTCSIGWAAFPWFSEAPDSVGYEGVIELADQALYAAKQAGRNRAIGMLPVDADFGNPNPSPAHLQATQVTTLGPDRAARSAGA